MSGKKYSTPFVKEVSANDSQLEEVVVSTPREQDISKREQVVAERETQEQVIKQQELLKKEKILNESATKERDAALKRRDAELALREAQLGPRRKNFPSCYPLFQHYIKEDIPPNLIKLVKGLYYCWMSLFLTLSINVVGSIALMVANGVNGFGTEGQQLVLSVLCLVGIPFMSVLLWYFPAYKVYVN
jgi:SCAMP family